MNSIGVDVDSKFLVYCIQRGDKRYPLAQFDNALLGPSTKFGIVRNSQGERNGLNGSPEYVKKDCDASLKRLGVECIDLYYQHRRVPTYLLRIPWERWLS